MGYDPNDPNQGSQAPAEDQATTEWQAKNALTSGSINDLVRSRPAIAAWFRVHNDGRDLSASDKQQLFGLLRTQGIDPASLEIDDDTGQVSSPKHTARDIALGSLLAFGPLVAAWAVPLVGGPGGAAAGGESAAAGSAGAGEAGAGLGSAWGADGTFLGSSTFGGGDAAAAGGSALGAAEGGSPWLADGTFAGDSTFSSVAGGGGSSVFGRLGEKYGVPVAEDALKGYLGQKNETAQIQAAKEARNQATALTESNLDPFRGYMHQASDVGKLDLMAEGNFQTSPVQPDAKYGKGYTPHPEQFYTPSTVMRTVARGNRDAIAAGQTAPTMTDPANYGKTPVGSYSGAAASSPATAVLTALRAKGLVTDDDNQTSPWLV